MKIEKLVKKYTKLYQKALKEQNFTNIKEKELSYSKRLTKLYNSEKFKEDNCYPTMNTELVYSVVAMSLELKDMGLDKQEIIKFSDIMFKKRKKFFKNLIAFINILPNSYKIAYNWNKNDHDKRVKDKSIYFEKFDVSDNCIEYKITKCKYVEIFEYYGIREMCKIFCRTDESAYSGLTKHVEYTRFSDLSDGNCCHDIVRKK